MKVFPDKVNLWLSETEIIDILLNWKTSKGFYDLGHFMNVLFIPTNNEVFSKIKGVFVCKNILREELGFEKGTKPGDFDVLLIPYTDDEIKYEFSAVFEVKIVRPTRKKPSKNADSLGFTQLKGLINDGFPLVGLMHISMPEPLVEQEKIILDFCTQEFDIDNPKNNKGVFESTIKIKQDQFSWYSADKQMKRLLCYDIPKYVGISCFGLDGDKDGSFFLCSSSREFSKYESGYFNPYCQKTTVKKIENHFLINKKKYIQRPIRT